MRKLLSRNKKKSRKKLAAKAKDYEAIITIQGKIIKARDHTFKIYDGMLAHIAEQFELEFNRMEKKIEASLKDRNEAIRRYNALHQLGEMAEGMGIDLTEKLPEHEFNKWKDHKFDIKGRVLESGKTTFSATLKKKVSQQQRDFPRLYKRGKKKK